MLFSGQKPVDILGGILYIIVRREFTRGVAQFGSARALGAWGRGFESLHPDQRKDVAPWSSG